MHKGITFKNIRDRIVGVRQTLKLWQALLMSRSMWQ